MSNFDELKEEAEIAIEQKWFNRFREEDAAAILELLAIQAQLVEALRNLIIAADNLDPQSGMPIGYQQLTDATTFADAALAAAVEKS